MLYLALSFILGFLVATGLALAAMPALWRRAGKQMRRRIEASMPMSREELQAEIDAVNAEHAMAIRRLEMKLEAIRKKAGQDFIEVNSLREQVKQLQESRQERDEDTSRLDEERQALAARLADREAELETVTSRLSEAERRLQDEHTELEQLSESYEEASLTSSSWQVALLARETELENLNDTVKRLRAEREQADQAVQKAAAEKKQIEDALEAERKRAEDLNRKLEGMTASLRSRDEKLERRQKEIARLKEKTRESSKGNGGKSLAQVKQENENLEMQVADLQLQLSTVLGSGEGIAPPTARKSRGKANGADDDTALREQIASLAAEVVSMTAALEGTDSPIGEALSRSELDKADGKAAAQTPSLAERVQALRREAQQATERPKE